LTTNAASSDATGADDLTRRTAVPRTKTLVVDDDPVARELMLRILRRAGHIAVAAASAEEALVRFHEHDPDLVLMDVVLPGMDGVEALRTMKKARGGRWLPIILVSVRDASDEVLAGLRAGADDYLTKPVVVDQVLAKLRNVSLSLSAHTKLRTSLDFTRAIMNHMVEGLLCADERGLIVASNIAAEKLFGFEAGRLIGVELQRLFIDGAQAEMPLGLGGSAQTVGMGCHQSGARFPLSIQQTTVEVDGGRVNVITVRDITAQLREERRLLNDAARLREYHAAREVENELAGKMLDRLLRRDRSVVRSVRSFTEAADGFSGDVVAAIRSPSGKLFVMLADATGHGLAAAISLVPALSVLHAMVGRECSHSEIVAELNTKLLDVMPIGRFLAAVVVCVDQARNSGSIWVGGMPAAFLLDRAGQVVQRFESTQLPLGIVASSPSLAEVVSFNWDRPLQLLMVSDGILEAENAIGAPFGEERLLRATAQTGGRDRLASILHELTLHLAGLKAGDDASVAFVDLD
jgi:two-component system, HptB-dependent secretion and biofilm response regulator